MPIISKKVDAENVNIDMTDLDGDLSDVAADQQSMLDRIDTRLSRVVVAGAVVHPANPEDGTFTLSPGWIWHKDNTGNKSKSIKGTVYSAGSGIVLPSTGNSAIYAIDIDPEDGEVTLSKGEEQPTSGGYEDALTCNTYYAPLQWPYHRVGMQNTTGGSVFLSEFLASIKNSGSTWDVKVWVQASSTGPNWTTASPTWSGSASPTPSSSDAVRWKLWDDDEIEIPDDYWVWILVHITVGSKDAHQANDFTVDTGYTKTAVGVPEFSTSDGETWLNSGSVTGWGSKIVTYVEPGTIAAPDVPSGFVRIAEIGSPSWPVRDTTTHFVHEADGEAVKAPIIPFDSTMEGCR